MRPGIARLSRTQEHAALAAVHTIPNPPLPAKGCLTKQIDPVQPAPSQQQQTTKDVGAARVRPAPAGAAGAAAAAAWRTIIPKLPVLAVPLADCVVRLHRPQEGRARPPIVANSPGRLAGLV